MEEGLWFNNLRLKLSNLLQDEGNGFTLEFSRDRKSMSVYCSGSSGSGRSTRSSAAASKKLFCKVFFEAGLFCR